MAVNDTIFSFGTQKTLVNGSGAAISNNAISAAAGTMDSTEQDDYLGVDLALTCAFGTNPTAGTSISVIFRPLNIDGTTDAVVPTAAYLNHVVGSFSVIANTSTNTYHCRVPEVPCREYEVYLYNNGTGQSISANWTLKARPFTYLPAAA